MTDTAKRGRPAEYRNAAEKQKAYRERLKAQNADSELALHLLGLIEQQAEALRNYNAYFLKRGEYIEIHHAKHHTQGLVNGYSRCSIESIVFEYLFKRDELEYLGKDWHCEKYRFRT